MKCPGIYGCSTINLFHRLVLANPEYTHCFDGWLGEFPTLNGFSLTDSTYVPINNIEATTLEYNKNLLINETFTIYCTYEDTDLNYISTDMFHSVNFKLWKDFHNHLVPEFLNNIMKVLHGDNWQNSIKIKVLARVCNTETYFLTGKTKLN